MTTTEEKDFIRKVFEIAFGDNAVPENMALPENDPDYRMPFTYDEVIERLEEYEKESWVLQQLEESKQEELKMEVGA